LGFQNKCGNAIEIPAVKVKKGTAVPLEAWTGPEVSRSLRFPDFKTIST
jgi:hypothetical protein